MDVGELAYLYVGVDNVDRAVVFHESATVCASWWWPSLVGTIPGIQELYGAAGWATVGAGSVVLPSPALGR